MTTHIILGTGSIGTPLAHDLVARGHDVIAVNRSGDRAGLPDSVELRVGDLTDPEFARTALAGGDVAYQLTQPAYSRWAQEFPELQRGVLAAAAATGTRVVLGDNLYCYGEPDGVITDASTPDPASRKGEVRLAMAEEALAAHERGDVEVALTRPSNYFGGSYGMTASLLVQPALAGKRMNVLGRTDQPHSFAYTPDVARAMADIGTADDTWGRAWVLPAMDAVTQADLCQRIWTEAAQQGDAKVGALRGFAMRAIGLVNANLRESAEMAYEFDAPFEVEARDFQERFGWAATPVDEAVRATVAQIAATG